MGRPDSVMQCYLSDKGRFADLFNGIFFQGKLLIRSCDLQDSSERYSEAGEPAGYPPSIPCACTMGKSHGTALSPCGT